MGILRARSVRKVGTWSSIGGAASDVEALRDGDDGTGLRKTVGVGDRLVMRLADGGVPEEGEITIRIRGRRTNGAVAVHVSLSQGDPGDEDRDKLVRFEADAPAALGNIARDIARAKQRTLNDFSDLWMAIRVVSHDPGARLFITDVRLVANDVPVREWNNGQGAPEGRLVWCRMGDGRARQGRRIAGEWEALDGSALEQVSGSLRADADGDHEASRWATGWGYSGLIEIELNDELAVEDEVHWGFAPTEGL